MAPASITVVRDLDNRRQRAGCPPGVRSELPGQSDRVPLGPSRRGFPGSDGGALGETIGRVRPPAQGHVSRHLKWYREQIRRAI